MSLTTDLTLISRAVVSTVRGRRDRTEADYTTARNFPDMGVTTIGTGDSAEAVPAIDAHTTEGMRLSIGEWSVA